MSLLPWRRKREGDDTREELESLAAIAGDDRRALGSLTYAAEEARALRTWTWLEHLIADLRYALRTMRQNPGFTATAVLTLALGIGSNTAIFSLINAVLLRPLTVIHPESLVVLTSYAKQEKTGDFGYQDYRILRDSNRVFTGILGASNLRRIDVRLGDNTHTAQHKIVSSNYFNVLGIQPAIGRLFAHAEDEQPFAVISDTYWKRAFASDPGVAGRTLDLDGTLFTIIGVTPAAFTGETVGESPDIWALPSIIPTRRRDAAGYTWLNLMARLKPGLNPAHAAADLRLIQPQLHNRFITRIDVEDGRLGGAGLRNALGKPLTVLMAMVALVLLIACANLEGLILARAARRKREIATRLAIGASRGRVIRQLTTESLVLAICGGALGLLWAVWSQRLLLSLVSGVGRTLTLDVRPDLRVLLFTTAISLAAGLLFGLVPAIQAVRDNFGEALKLHGQSLAGRRRWGLTHGLLAFQIGVSLVLVVTGGLFVRTLRNLQTQDLGFQPSNVLSLQIGVQRGRGVVDWQVVAPQLLERIEAIPGVQAAAVSFNGILGNGTSGVNGLQIVGQPPTAEGFRAGADWITPRYFAVHGIPLLEGRPFSPADDLRAPKVAIVNETMARSHLAVGQQFEFRKDRYQVIGIAKDARSTSLRKPPGPVVYFAALQSYSGLNSLNVRASGSPDSLTGAIRNVISQTEPRLKIGEVMSLPERLRQKLSTEFLVADLAGFFGGLTVLLVGIGIYGTLAYAVARRTNEIALRMALGARADGVLATILRDTLIVIAVGLAAGLAAATAVTRLTSSILYGLTPNDPLTLAASVTLLTIAAIAAAYIPARRATRIDPVSALRME